ncbi:uncharacterized protein LOC129738648 isoform X2 [Uranotaenia lowii]|uniref:uncharacterized protein LOC129738648 isoform X2 n=1 Tax=Uranotaenia lowii TaxID=190385 RepID=UPI0024790DBC|nr:uncharacterized protein LOC129738648 isoform X2 [Uranotaenia lowii]
MSTPILPKMKQDSENFGFEIMKVWPSKKKEDTPELPTTKTASRIAFQYRKFYWHVCLGVRKPRGKSPRIAIQLPRSGAVAYTDVDEFWSRLTPGERMNTDMRVNGLMRDLAVTANSVMPSTGIVSCLRPWPLSAKKQFQCMNLSAGVIPSFGSHVLKTVTRQQNSLGGRFRDRHIRSSQSLQLVCGHPA